MRVVGVVVGISWLINLFEKSIYLKFFELYSVYALIWILQVSVLTGWLRNGIW